MANQRCFNKSIVRSDEFMSLPASARDLYYELGMETDNRGYVSGWKRLLVYFGASEDDLKLLLAKRFFLLRQDGRLILQKHFNKNNSLRMNRCSETEFIDDFNQIFINENGDYTERDTGIKALDYRAKVNTPGVLQANSRQLPAIKESKVKESKVKESNVIQSKETSKERYEDDFIFDED